MTSLYAMNDTTENTFVKQRATIGGGKMYYNNTIAAVRRVHEDGTVTFYSYDRNGLKQLPASDYESNFDKLEEIFNKQVVEPKK